MPPKRGSPTKKPLTLSDEVTGNQPVIQSTTVLSEDTTMSEIDLVAQNANKGLEGLEETEERKKYRKLNKK